MANQQATRDDMEPDLNADLSKRVIVETEKMTWSGSPSEGVERKRLYLAGDDYPKLTTLVRFAPGSFFDEHVHDCGEEFLVLEGTFSDQFGDFPAGSYVRNPPGTKHKPHTEEGCTIFVKLRQFDPRDSEQLVIDTNDEIWITSETDGVSEIPLHRYQEEVVSLYKLSSNSELSIERLSKGCECFIIEGELALQNEPSKAYGKGTWIRLPGGEDNTLYSQTGCTFYLKTPV